MAGAWVNASGSSYDQVVTDAAGKYQLKGLAAGSYRLSVSAPSDTNYLSGYYTSANANRFTIAYASASSITIGPSKTGMNVKLPAGFTISGTLTNTGGTALSDVVVQPTSATYNGRAVVTDAAGKYTLKGLAAATYKLALSPGSSSSYMDGYYTTTNTNHFTSQVAGASGVVVGPSKTGINAKIVTGRTISGKVTTTTGTPLQYASVSASNLGHTRSAQTDASGNFTIKGLSSTGQTLRLTPPYGQNLMTGYYTTSNANRFTSVATGATAIVVPPNATGILIKIPKGYSIAGKIDRARRGTPG